MDDAVLELRSADWTALRAGYQAVADQFSAEPNRTVRLRLPAGSWRVTPQDGGAAVQPVIPRNMGPDAFYIIEGCPPYNTRLICEANSPSFGLRDARRVRFRHIAWDKTRRMATQGRVLAVGDVYVDLELDLGYPRIETVFDPSDLDPDEDDGRNQRWLRKKEPAAGFIGKQLPWYLFEHLGARRYRLFAGLGADDVWSKSTRRAQGWERGDHIAIKSKGAGGGFGRIVGGDGCGFEDCAVYETARAYMGCANPVWNRNIIVRSDLIAGIAPLLVGNGGGPQFHGELLAEPHGCLECQDNYIEHTGDDGIGVGDWNGTALIENNLIVNNFARGIAVWRSPLVQALPLAETNQLVNNPLRIGRAE